MSAYSSDEDVNIRFTRRHGASPPRDYGYAPEPAVRHRPVSYFPVDRPYLAPERTVIRARSRSRERYRQSPPQSPPVAAPAPAPAPVIIHNQIYNDQDSDDDYRKLQVARPRRERSHSRGDSRDRDFMTREQYEMERTRQQLEEMRLSRERDLDRDRNDHRAKDYRKDADLRLAKRELDEIKSREERQKEQERLKKEIELERMREEEREAEEKARRDKEAKAAVEKYKQEEAERRVKEQKEKELAEKEFQRRLQEQLIASGLDEKAIEAVLKKEKIKAEKEKPAPAPAPYPVQGNELARPTYTRMSRRHLSIETLRVYHVDFDYDQDPEFVLIKRWVPDWEQNTLWMHTRELRERRSSGGRLLVDVGDHDSRRRHKDDPGFEWVRKKGGSSRKRSKSPALLMYLAGAKPA